MNNKIINSLFFFIGISLIFNNIPKVIQLNLLGGPFGNKLTIYFLLIGFIYIIYEYYKYDNELWNINIFKRYIIIYIFFLLISLVIGLVCYPYYDQILMGPIDQIGKMPQIISLLTEMGYSVDEKFLLIMFMILRTLKNMILEIIYAFFGAYMIYYWFYKKWEKGFIILNKSVMISIGIILAYSLIEIFYLAGNRIAFDILGIITPYIHSIKDNSNWWPPLYWDGQLRSVFAEPSYFGVYIAFAMPFLWYNINRFENYKIIYCLCCMSVCFCLFLTKSRTAIVLLIGEVFLLLIYLFYLRNKDFLKNVIIIIICIITSFVCSNIFISNMMNKNSTNNIEKYVEKNITSVVSTNERSNTARYSIIIANLRIGLNYPLMGVGSNLRHAYITEYLPSMSKNSNEINDWLYNQKKEGILKAVFPSLGEYSTRFAETGCLGLLIFLFPTIILLIKLRKIIHNDKMCYCKRLMYIFYSISFIAIFMAGFGDGLNITYCYWVLLGLGYAMCFGEPGDEIKHE